MTDPYRPTDDEARALARDLIDTASFAALAVQHPDDGQPTISRIALATDPRGIPVSLISTLSEHTRALAAYPACALLVGEPEEKGDPLTHPRLTLHVTAQIIPHAEDAALRSHYLAQRPKAKLYAGFTDFHFVRFAIRNAMLNGGFGKAYKLTPADLSAA